MPFPPPTPNELTTSAFPSPVVSRKSRAATSAPHYRERRPVSGPVGGALTRRVIRRAQQRGGVTFETRIYSFPAHAKCSGVSRAVPQHAVTHFAGCNASGLQTRSRA